MNFATVRTIIDQKAENGYAATMPMFGIITEFKGEGLSSSNKPWKKVVVRDDANELHNVTLRGTLPGPQVIGQRCQFDMSSYNGDANGQPYIGYSGFWKHGPVAQQGQQAPQQPRPAPNAPPRQPQAPPTSDGNASICRQCAGKCAARLVAAHIAAGNGSVGVPEIFAIAEPLANWFIKGELPKKANVLRQQTEPDDYDASNVPDPDPSIQEAPTGDDIPF